MKTRRSSPSRSRRSGRGTPTLLPSPPPGFEILRELGRGGMGVVYLAQQRHPARLVALKVLRTGGHSGASDKARFLAEADAIGRLQHPGIVQIHEVGETAGLPYLALEYVEGGTLAARLKGEPQPPKQAAALVATLAESIEVAHQAGIIHRDLKPANILLATATAPKITDFGLAKHAGPDLTATGECLGTPSYMAPEQAAGAKVGPSADVWALGAILYECLTGRPPFRGSTPLETFDQLRSQEVLPLSDCGRGCPRTSALSASWHWRKTNLAAIRLPAPSPTICTAC